jgi:hypothetical protein
MEASSPGGKVLGVVRHPFNTADFSSFLLQACLANQFADIERIDATVDPFSDKILDIHETTVEAVGQFDIVLFNGIVYHIRSAPSRRCQK